MSRCAHCGAPRARDDFFCGSCGEPLDSKFAAGEPADPHAIRAGSPASARPQLASSPATVPAPDDVPEPAAEEDPSAQHRDAAVVEPMVVSDPPEPDPVVRPVKPGEEWSEPPRPPRERRDEPEPKVDGPTCLTCGTRNPSARTFCRRCGAHLPRPSGPEAARPSWWRRIVRRVVTRPPRRYPSGQYRRPGSRGPRSARRAGGAIRRLLALALVGAVVVGATGPWRSSIQGAASDAYDAVRSFVEDELAGNRARESPERRQPSSRER